MPAATTAHTSIVLISKMSMSRNVIVTEQHTEYIVFIFDTNKIAGFLTSIYAVYINNHASSLIVLLHTFGVHIYCILPMHLLGRYTIFAPRQSGEMTQEDARFMHGRFMSAYQ